MYNSMLMILVLQKVNKMNKYKMLLICLILLLVLGGCSQSETEQEQVLASSQSTTGNLSNIFKISDWVTFVDINDANEKLMAEGGYFSTLREIEKKYYFYDVILPKQPIDPANNSDKSVPNNNSNIVDMRYLARQWNIKEQDEVLRIILKFEDAFAQSGCSFENVVPVIKILGHSRLPDVFALQEGIVISESAFNLTQDELETELIKAFFSYYLKKHTEVKNHLLELCGYTPLENLSIPDVFADHIIIRPEQYQPYVLRAKRTDIKLDIEGNWVPISFIDAKNKTIHDYMVSVNQFQDGKAVISEVNSANLYLKDLDFMNKYVAVSPRFIKGEVVDMTHCDDSSYHDDSRVHPEDILCRKYEHMIQNRGAQDDLVIQVLKQVL